MKVLVTGAAGFIGHHLVSSLLMQTPWKIVALDRRLVTSESSDYDERLRVVHDDIQGTMTAPWCEGVDAVVNLASSSDVPKFLDNPYEHTMNNVMSTLTLLEWARYQNLRSFIQLSTNEVYGPLHLTAAANREWDPMVPQTPYSASKAAQEMLMIGWRQTYGVPAVIVNTMHVFGEGQPRQRFIPSTIDKILSGDPVKIYRYPDGAPIRNWTYVGDLVQALIWLLIRGVQPGDRPERWNVVGPQISCHRVARAIGHLLKRDFTVDWLTEDERRPGYDFRYALDGSKIENEGFSESFGFISGLRRTVDWIKNERETDET